MNKITIITLILLAATAYRCTSPTAGGSSDHGSGRCAGIIINPLGDPAEGMKVIVLPDTLNYAADSSSANVFETITDSLGMFLLDSLPCGTFCVSGADDWSHGSFRKTALRIGKDSTIDLDTIRLYEAGSISFNIDTLGIQAGTILYFPGLPLCHVVDSSRNQSIDDVPAGSVEVMGYDPARNVSFKLDIEYRIEVLPGKQLFLRPLRLPRPWHIIDGNAAEQKLSGGSADSIYLFSAVDPTQQRPAGIRQYRFSWGDGAISQWSYDHRAEYAWKKPGSYYVQTQLMIDNNTCLAWSEETIVTIEKAQ